MTRQPPLLALFISCLAFFAIAATLPAQTAARLNLTTGQVAPSTALDDTTPPYVVEAAMLFGGTQIGLRFDDFMDPASLTNPAHYRLEFGGQVTNVSLRDAARVVALGVSARLLTNFTLTLAGVQDLAGNFADTNALVPVTVLPLESTDIGLPGFDPAKPGSVFATRADAFEIVAGGSAMDQTQDRFHFAYQVLEGDFDVQARVDQMIRRSDDPNEELTSEVPGAAGLMVRQDLSPGSPSLLVGLYPPRGRNQFFANYRQAYDTNYFIGPVINGVVLSNAWLRLVRHGNTLTPYYSGDGTQWNPFYAKIMNLPARVFVGPAVCANENAPLHSTIAVFSQYQSVGAVISPGPSDLLVRKGTNDPPQFGGAGLYQVFPAGAQIETRQMTSDYPASFQVKCRNEDSTPRSLVLRATETGSPGWRVSYDRAGANISSAIRACGYATPLLPPGGEETVTVSMTPGPTVAYGASHSALLSLRADRYSLSTRDVVQLLVTNMNLSRQSDLSARRAGDWQFTGAGIFNLTGDGQVVAQDAAPGTTATYILQLRNAGNVNIFFKLQAGPAAPGWNARYLSSPVEGAGVDFTAAVTGSGYYAPLLTPGAAFEFRLEATPGEALPPGSVQAITISASAVGGYGKDAVRLVTTMPASNTTPQDFVFTTDADFQRGRLLGLVITNGQLQLDSRPSAFPFLWVPNRDDATVSKLDTRTGRELARYRTGAYCCANPSQIAVDQSGNCWVANRDHGTVVKIGLREAGQGIDRNANGRIDTSADLNNDGNITDAEFLPWGQDECVLFEVVLAEGREGVWPAGAFPGPYARNHWNPGPRGLALDPWGNLWAGTHDSMKYYYIDGESGQILWTNAMAGFDHQASGAVIDNSGMLWSAGWPQAHVLRFDPRTGEAARLELGAQAYALGLDAAAHLFVSLWGEHKFARIKTATAAIDWIIHGVDENARGLAVTPDGDVWLANTASSTITRWSNDGALKNTLAGFAEPTGLNVDDSGKIWVLDQADEYVHRIDPQTDSIDLSKRIAGSVHEGCGDGTGWLARNVVARVGQWSAIWDSGTAGTPWGFLDWISDEPPGASVQLRVRSSADRRSWSSWEWTQNGALLLHTPPGRYLEIEAVLQTLPGAPGPQLSDLALQPLHRPILLSPRLTNGLFTASFQTQPGLIYLLQYKDALADPAWQLLRRITGAGALEFLTDQPGVNMRFYRIEIENVR